MSRTGSAERKTGETFVRVRLELDGTGRVDVSTGVGFLDHLLHLLAHPSGMGLTVEATGDTWGDGHHTGAATAPAAPAPPAPPPPRPPPHSGRGLTVEAKGDTWVDDHHTVEDTGLVLGRAFDEALGERSGITRFADASAPLIEALSTAVVDFGARSHLTCNLGPMPEKVGTFDVELFPEFLRAFTQYGRFTLHLNCHYGENAHHKVESGVKALAVALRAGVATRTGGSASTKGVVD